MRCNTGMCTSSTRNVTCHKLSVGFNTSMVTRHIKLLNDTKAKVARLERVIATQLSRELASLPRKYGFVDVQDFITAVRNGAGKAMVSAGNKVAVNGRNGIGRNGNGRKPRVVITAETKSRVKSLVAAGKTGNEIAKALNISLPSVQNIKKELGLVRRRSK